MQKQPGTQFLVQPGDLLSQYGWHGVPQDLNSSFGFGQISAVTRRVTCMLELANVSDTKKIIKKKNSYDISPEEYTD